MAWRLPQVLEAARQSFDLTIAHSVMEGLLAMVVPPIVIGIFAATFFGLPFAVIFAFLYGLLLIGAGMAAIVTLGDWLMLSFGRPMSELLRSRLTAIGCGTIFWWLMTEFLGGIAVIFAAVLGFGVLAALTERVLAPKATP
jgi:hypothetical protein